MIRPRPNRFRISHRRIYRALRAHLSAYHGVLIALGAVVALVLGGLLYQGLAEPEPIPLGAGKAGVKDHPAVLEPSSEPPAAPVPEAGSARERGRPAGEGEASYYGDELAGNPTASGERFDPNKLTAAHRTLPLGTRLRVTNMRNGKSVIVRVNDRGPFTGRRVLDVSKAAARRLGMLARGTAPVRLELLPG